MEIRSFNHISVLLFLEIGVKGMVHLFLKYLEHMMKLYEFTLDCTNHFDVAMIASECNLYDKECMGRFFGER